MKNFLRVLRHAFPYRFRLALSIVAALCAAVLWGLNFTSIYPVLKLLNSGESLHRWVDRAIDDTQKSINELQPQVDQLDAQCRELQDLPPSRHVDKVKRDLSGKLLTHEVRLQRARFSMYWYQILSKYIHLFLPDDCFLSLAYLIGLVVVGILIKCFFEFCQESLVGNVVNNTLCDLRNRFFRNVIHLDVGQFNGQGSTELMARFTNDVESLAAGLKMLFGRAIAEPLKVMSCVIIACLISWQLTLMFLVLVPIAAIILYKVARIMKQATRRVLERMSSIYKVLHESFEGIRLVKVFAMEARARRRFREVTRDYHQKSMRVINIEALADPLIEVLGIAAVAGALLVGSYLVLTGETELLGIQMTSARLEAASMLQLYILLAAIADPVRKLSSVFTRLQSANAAADRIFAFVDRHPRVAVNSDAPRLVRPSWVPARLMGRGEGGAVVVPARPSYIEFRDVCFSYEPGVPILSHISVSIRAGETIALVGANGSGKSTLVGLLPRFYDPDHGSVLIDGTDLRRLQLRSVRRQIGLVTQDTFLFEGTIFDNIAYGARNATAEDVEEAARRAHAHDFILRLPGGQGYQTPVAKGGVTLSGGQKQRVALARAILRNPTILILDEFTSQADTESQLEIHRALQEYKAGRNVFVITHQLHTLEIADRIIVLDQGRIVAAGTHAELLAACGIYQRLHEAQNQRLCA